MPPIGLDDTQERRSVVLEIVNELRSKGDIINRYTLQPLLKQRGFDVSFATIYRDMTSLNQKNTWVRDLASSNYSAYQESISSNLDWVEQQAQERFRETKAHVWLSIIQRVQETKMKHTNGENINIAAALIGKKYQDLKEKSEKKEEEPITVDVIKLATARR